MIYQLELENLKAKGNMMLQGNIWKHYLHFLGEALIILSMLVFFAYFWKFTLFIMVLGLIFFIIIMIKFSYLEKQCKKEKDALS
jgi:ABC-type bacteriocin/lantibiotic exporter with double-glycine peptidase domain